MTIMILMTVDKNNNNPSPEKIRRTQQNRTLRDPRYIIRMDKRTDLHMYFSISRIVW